MAREELHPQSPTSSIFLRLFPTKNNKMSEVSGVRYWPYHRTRAVGPSAPIRPTQLQPQPPPTFASGYPSTEFCTLRRGSMPRRHLSLRVSYLATPPNVRPNGTGVQSRHQIRVQLSAGQAYTYQGTRGEHYGGQTPFNLLQGARPVNNMTVYPPYSGEPHRFSPGRCTPIAYNPDTRRPSADSHLPVARNPHPWITGWHSQTTQSLSANWQAATPPLLPARNQDLSKLSSTTIQPSPPASMMSVQGASPIGTSSAREEIVGSKELPFTKEACPFPKCKVKCGRPQDLERHIHQHLPYYIYCGQPRCNWTGNRRYALRAHLADKHKGVPMPELFTIYDAKGLVKQLLNKEIDVEQVVGDARLLFQQQAVQLGKLGIWRWMRGLKSTCVPTPLEV